MRKTRPLKKPFMNEKTTLVLLRRVQGGEATSDALVERLYDRFCRIASRVLGKFPSLQERGLETGDVVHTVYQELQKTCNLESVESCEHLLNSVAQLMRLRLIDMARLHTNQQVRSPVSANVPANGDNEIAAVEQREIQLKLHEAIEDLPKDLKQVIELRFYCGLKQDEIAEIVEVHVTTVRKRLSKAKERLAQKLPQPD
jgi:RNA polymerase sigma factor (sigma-70 family)